MSATNSNLTPEQIQTLQDGQALAELIRTPGWQVIQKMLENRMYHTWVDPRECKDDADYLRQEYNLFYAREAAQELITEINELILQANELESQRKGETNENPMRI